MVSIDKEIARFDPSSLDVSAGFARVSAVSESIREMAERYRTLAADLNGLQEKLLSDDNPT